MSEDDTLTKCFSESVEITPDALKEIREPGVHDTILKLFRMDVSFDFPDFGIHYISNTPMLYPKPDPRTRMTVVLDLDETMVRAHCHTCKIAIRPRLLQFLNYAIRSSEIEIIVWTAGVLSHALRCIYAVKLSYEKEYGSGSFMLNGLIFRGRWYYTYGKDVSKLGRPDGSVILIDNTPDHVTEASGSALLIESYESFDVHEREFMERRPPFLFLITFCRLILRLQMMNKPVNTKMFIKHTCNHIGGIAYNTSHKVYEIKTF